MSIDISNYESIGMVIPCLSMGLGDRLQKQLDAEGMSQAELARRVGISQPSINHLIKRGSGGSAHLHKIARALNTTPEYLTGETDNPKADFVPAPSTDKVAKDLGLVPVREIDLTLGLGASYLDVPVTETIHHFPANGYGSTPSRLQSICSSHRALATRWSQRSEISTCC